MKTPNNFHILIVDDEKLNIELVAAYLKEEGYQLSFALNATAALESVGTKKIDLILLDINMPQVDGFALCTMLKKNLKTKDIPVIFLTAQTDISYISQAFEVGGIDYISKPFNGVELKIRVKTQLQNLAYFQEIKEKQSKLAQLSITDTLTKLHNALYFEAQMRIFMKKEKPYWFLFLKINQFEKLNKLYGYHPANKILKKFAVNLQKSAFSNAVVGRLYGASFGILVKDYSKENIKTIYETILKTHAQDANMAKLCNFNAVFYNVNGANTIETLYKRVHNSLDKIVSQGEKLVFIQ
ncbi:GGDEF domain-containing response regulator [Sulfurimonas sp.]